LVVTMAWWHHCHGTGSFQYSMDPANISLVLGKQRRQPTSISELW
jgi:hypothetical protein